jgi:hypothetical protein
MTPKSNLDKAFSELRKLGFIAKQNFMCCGGCAGDSLANRLKDMSKDARERVQGVLFYTKQDAADLRKNGDFYLHYGTITVYFDNGKSKTYGRPTKEVGEAVVEVFSKYGIKTEWNGDPNEKIHVTEIEA